MNAKMDTLHLPRRIQRALDRLVGYRRQPDALARPEKSQFLVMTQILRCACAINPHAPIVIKKSTMAENLDLCKKTIDRALAMLEELGWIKRLEQVKSRRLGFRVGEILLSQAAVDALFVKDGVTTDKEVPVENLGKNVPRLLDSSVSKDTASLEERPLPAASVFEKDMERRIEPGLQVLLEYFNAKTINWLKGQASQKKKRLEDIVTYLLPSISKIRNLKNYLLTCIRLETDFKGKLRLQNAIATKEKQKIIKKTELQTFEESMKGSKKVDQRTGNTLVFEGSHVLVANAQGKLLGSTPISQIFEQVSSGQLKFFDDQFAEKVIDRSLSWGNSSPEALLPDRVQTMVDACAQDPSLVFVSSNTGHWVRVTSSAVQWLDMSKQEPSVSDLAKTTCLISFDGLLEIDHFYPQRVAEKRMKSRSKLTEEGVQALSALRSMAKGMRREYV